MAQPSGVATSESATSQPSRSHGRGGAGNINSKPGASIDPSTLQTPTIKQATYTTGRGGTGNMAQNDPKDPAAARVAQDVDAPRAHDREPKGTYHWGRGGEGNMMTLGGGNGTEKAEARPANPLRSGSRASIEAASKRRTGSFQAALDKGREIFGLNAKKDAAASDENAVE